MKIIHIILLFISFFKNIENLKANNMSENQNSDFYQSSCSPEILIWNFDQSLNIGQNECPKATNFIDSEDQEMGCDCVASRKQPINCQDYLNFQKVILQNFNDIKKIDFINQTKKTIYKLTHFGLSGQSCSIQDELKKCNFKFKSLNQILEEYNEYQIGNKINNISELEYVNSSQDSDKNRLLLKYNYYGKLNRILSNNNMQGIDNDLLKYITNAMIPEHNKGIRIESERFNSFYGSNSALYRKRTDSKSSKNVPFLDNEKVLEELIQLSDEIKNLDDDEKESAIKIYFSEIEQINEKNYREKFDELCIDFKKTTSESCGNISDTEEDSNNESKIHILNSKELINFVVDSSAKLIPQNISPDKKKEATQMINYLVEWFACGTLYYEKKEEFNKFVTNIESCSGSNIAKLNPEQINEILTKSLGSYETLFSENNLTEEQKKETEEQYNYISEYLSEAGLLEKEDVQPNQNLNNKGQNNFEQISEIKTNITNNQEINNESKDPTGFTPNSKQNKFSSNSFSSNSFSTLKNPNSDKPSKENFDKELNTSNSTKKVDSRIEELLRELDAKRSELQKLKDDLEKVKNEKNSQKLTNKIKATERDISKIERDLSSIPNELPNKAAEKKPENKNEYSQPNLPNRSVTSEFSAATNKISSTGNSNKYNQKNISNLNYSSNGISSYDSINKSDLIENTKSAKEFNYNNSPINILGTLLNSGIINIISTPDGDVLQIYEHNGNDPKKVDIIFQFQISSGQGIESLISGLQLSNSNDENLEDFKERIMLVFNTHNGIISKNNKIDDQNNTNKSSEPTLIRRRAEYDQLNKIIESEIK